MPTYEYQCRKCRCTFEEFQAITAEPLKKCRACGGRVDRVIGAGGGILFKGSGFYQTDYRSENYRRAAAAETAAPAGKMSAAEKKK